MRRNRQAELIRQMSDREVTLQLVITQLILLVTALVVSLFVFDAFWADWLTFFPITIEKWLWYGVFPGVLILLIDLMLMYSLPKKYYDDGGINEKVFENRSVLSILFLTLLIAFSEEMLFRGVLHTSLGYIPASILFAVIHFRYLTKPVLIISVLFVSFLIGYMFEVTGNLTVTITAHFIVDFVLGLWIRFGKWGGNDGK
ncbi:CPBP family intramembrane metalloprotease [Halobacillus litoralis]|uniref:CPBP family intramembrane glutamic endopeptidase n=1 Tax=Halobacillus litoralis TaxID=45668 RepID=UPI001CD1DAB5|nr:CPBP family intramembrane glutamic endopeptidase [Halobacillus litoralis]MCA0970312.1 CPBP family intramembrane metalloprotease [Halobacillus litoralis]